MKHLKKYKSIYITIFISLFLEIFLCNYSFFRTIFIGNNNITPTYTFQNNIISITNINTRITSLNIEYNNNNLKDKITYGLTYTAEESSIPITINEKTLLRNSRQYINFDTHSKCQKIYIILKTENKDLSIKNIYLNKPNLNINLFRILLFIITTIIIIKIKDKSIYKYNYNKNSYNQKLIFNTIIFLLCFTIGMYTIMFYKPKSFLINRENINPEHSMFVQAESIMNGQIDLIVKPSEELLALKDPYDYTLRNSLGIKFLFDVAFYNGKYQNYFGIAPVLTSILPFRILTGNYTHSYLFNLIYIFTIIISLSILYKKLINKYIKKVSLFNFYLGLFTIIFASNILTNIRGEKYDLALTCGLSFILISLNLALSLYDNHKYKNLKLILLGITTALIVLSKPNLIIYYILILFFFLTSSKKLTLKEKYKNILLIFIPLSIFAIFQMYLNYTRFDSIFEFGVKYQLTNFNLINQLGIGTNKIYSGIIQYIFNTANINPLQFPFIFINKDISNISMNEIIYENKLVGLISIPIMYIFLLKSNILKKYNNKEFKTFINISLILSILSMIISACFSGICEPYSIDFKLILSITATLLALKWIDLSKNDININKIFLILCISTLIIMIPISLNSEADFLTNLTNDMTVILKNTFEFWT